MGTNESDGECLPLIEGGRLYRQGKCRACKRVMRPWEVGDETPEERVCDACAGYTPDAQERKWIAERKARWETQARYD